MTVTVARKRKRNTNVSFAYVDRVMNGLARSIKYSNEAFRKEMRASSEEFARTEREANEAFRKEMRASSGEFARTEREANEAFRKEMRASSEEFARTEREANEAFRKEIRASLDEADKRFYAMVADSEKRWNKKMGEIYNRLGDIAEYTFVPEAILEKFRDLNYEFDNYCRRERIIDKDGFARAEYDVVLRNGDTVALVEIKSVFKYAYIDSFIEQISVATDEKYKGKNIIGAIAALELPKEVKKYAMKRGLYVIEQAGLDIKIDTQDGKFKPKIW